MLHDGVQQAFAGDPSCNRDEAMGRIGMQEDPALKYRFFNPIRLRCERSCEQDPGDSRWACLSQGQDGSGTTSSKKVDYLVKRFRSSGID